MSMLADHRRKTKWVINPTKKPIWSTDSSGIQFGKQLMEKMGWSAGKGLGLKEQGIQEPLKVSFKNDTKGMGFKGNDDDWIEHQDEFNILLNQLRSNDDSSTAKAPDVEKNEIKSLEEKSKRSKARVHYQKFTRGKDLSKYSENDLACILGTGKTRKKEIPEIKEVAENKTDTVGNFETSFGVTTINSGSINDYFKKKWASDKLKPNGLTNEADEEENFRPCFSNTEPCFSVSNESFANSEGEGVKSHKKKHKSKYEKDILIEEESRVPELDYTEKVEKKKRKAKVVESNSEEEPESKKTRKNSDENSSIANDSLSLVKENDYNSEKKKKKDKNHVVSEIVSEEVDSRKEKKERKKGKRTLEEGVVDNDLSHEEINTQNNIDDTVEVETVKRKKKKKEKTEKAEESEVIVGIHSNSNEAENVVECHLGVAVKNKKKKMKNLEKSEEININNDDVHSSDSSVEVGNTEQMNDVEAELEKKKKKKKDKKEKVGEFNDLNQEVPCNSMNNSHQDLGKINGSGEQLDSGKKKRKKKARNQEEYKEVEYQSIEELCSEETSTCKVDSICDNALEIEPTKKKKKKKDKKEKLETESKEKEPCLEEDNALGVEYIEKKKKKKHKKEKMESKEGVENKEEPNGEVIGENPDLCEGNNEVSDALNTNKQGEDRIQKLRTTLFPDQSADKYFPGQSTNERVLKLIKWANIAEFKGSNLNDVEGYGRRKMYERKSR